jgi:ATP-dependent exoDNAse (exonuclease V) alpha subunit
MATSAARLQLAIAPAGTGKTTALQALTRAWLEGGGQVIGLAPSAAAATQLPYRHPRQTHLVTAIPRPRTA